MSTCFFICTQLTVIWCLVFFKYDGNDGKCHKSSESNRETAFWKSEFSNVCSFMELFVSLLVYTAVFCRFFLPLENIGKRDLFNVLQDYLVNGSDSVEFYSYMDVPKISQHFSDVYAILCKLNNFLVYSNSLFEHQFLSERPVYAEHSSIHVWASGQTKA